MTVRRKLWELGSKSMISMSKGWIYLWPREQDMGISIVCASFVHPKKMCVSFWRLWKRPPRLFNFFSSATDVQYTTGLHTSPTVLQAITDCSQAEYQHYYHFLLYFRFINKKKHMYHKLNPNLIVKLKNLVYRLYSPTLHQDKYTFIRTVLVCHRHWLKSRKMAVALFLSTSLLLI
jgi:hypothetical protein